MKILVFILSSIPFLLQAQISISSVLDGNWSDTLTWGGSTIPSPGDTIMINNAVILDTDFAYSSGSINVESNGSLVDDLMGRNISMMNGLFSNEGFLEVDTIMLGGGAFSNLGDWESAFVENNASIVNHENILIGYFINIGTLQNNNSFEATQVETSGAIDNFANMVVTDSLTNEAFVNNYNSGAFMDLGTVINNSFFTNEDSLHFGYLYNYGNFGNYANASGDDLLNQSDFINGNGSLLDLSNNSYNDAQGTFTNDGTINIADSWFNGGTVQGASTGNFTVQDTSNNGGIMTGDFTFCDMTPPTTAPYVDLNIGTIDASVIFCQAVAIDRLNGLNPFELYPNPASDKLYLNTSLQNYKVEFYNAFGQLLFSDINSIELSMHNLPTGSYFVKITDLKEKKYYSQQILKQ